MPRRNENLSCGRWCAWSARVPLSKGVLPLIPGLFLRFRRPVFGASSSCLASVGFRALCGYCMPHSLVVFDLWRTQRGFNSCTFLDFVWRRWSCEVLILSFLSAGDRAFFARCCVVCLLDFGDLSLAITARREQLSTSGWTVPTPPLARALSSNSHDLSSEAD